MYTVRQATENDWPLISAFIDRTYGAAAPFKQRDRWHWQFRDNPFAKADEDTVPVWIAFHGGEVVGQIALQPGRLWLDGIAFPAGWIVDVMVDRAHRGRGLSHRINEAIVSSGRTLMTLTMAPATRSIMERAGCLTLPPVYQMVRPRNLSGRTIAVLLSRIARNRPNWQPPIDLFVRSRVGPAGLAKLLSAGAWLRRIGRPCFAGMEEIAFPDAADVNRLERLLGDKPLGFFDRSSAQFAWRYRDAPDLAYRFAESRSDGGAIRAILVSRLPLSVELPVGTIVDILCDPADRVAIGAAIDHAVAVLADRCEAMIAGASHPNFVAAYTKRGFLAVKKHRPTIVTNDRALLKRVTNHSGPWHFSKADHDWDQVHPADG